MNRPTRVESTPPVTLKPVPVVPVQPTIPQPNQSVFPNPIVIPDRTSVSASTQVPVSQSAATIVSAAQPTLHSTLQTQSVSPSVVQVVPSGNTQNPSPVAITGPTGSPLPRVLPSCFTIDAVTDDIFRDGE